MIVNATLCGGLQGLVGSTNQGRGVVRGERRAGAARSGRQRVIASIFAGLQYRWSGGLSQAQRDAWDAYAAALGEMTGGCDPRPRTGKDFFLGANLIFLNRTQFGSTPFAAVDDGPTVHSRPPGPASVPSITAAGPGFGFFGSFTSTTPGAGLLCLYIFHAVAEVRRDLGDPWHLAHTGGFVAGQSNYSGFFELPDPPSWLADWSIDPGDRVRVKARAWYADGRYSVASRGFVQVN